MANPFIEVPAGDPAFQRAYLAAVMQAQEYQYKAALAQANQPTFGTAFGRGLARSIPASINEYLDYLFNSQLLEQRGRQAMAHEQMQQQAAMDKQRMIEEAATRRALLGDTLKSQQAIQQQTALGGALGDWFRQMQPSTSQVPTGAYEVGPLRAGPETSFYEGPVPGVSSESLTVPESAVVPTLGPLIDVSTLAPRREPIEEGRRPVLGPEMRTETRPGLSPVAAFTALDAAQRGVIGSKYGDLITDLADPTARPKREAALREAQAKADAAQQDAIIKGAQAAVADRTQAADADKKAADAQDAAVKAERARLEVDAFKRALAGGPLSETERALLGIKEPAERILPSTATMNDYLGTVLGIVTPEDKATYLKTLDPTGRQKLQAEFLAWAGAAERSRQAGREQGREGLEQPPAASMDRYRTSVDASKMLNDMLALSEKVDLRKIAGGLKPIFNEIAQTGLFAGLPVPESIRPTLTGEEMQFLALLNDYADQVLRIRSGAQINEEEFRRMLRFLASEHVTPETMRERLTLQDRRLDQQIESLETLWSQMGLRTPRTPWRDLKSGLRGPGPTQGRIRVRRKSDGSTGTVESKDFDPTRYERLE